MPLKIPSKYLAQIKNSQNLSQILDSQYLASLAFVPDVPPYLLYEMCNHCNNFFNAENSGFDLETVLENAPEGFLRLAVDIENFKRTVELTNVTNATVGRVSDAIAIDYTSWRIMFNQQLALYRRVNAI